MALNHYLRTGNFQQKPVVGYFEIILAPGFD